MAAQLLVSAAAKVVGEHGRVGVVGPEHGQVEALLAFEAVVLQLHLDAGRRPPHPKAKCDPAAVRGRAFDRRGRVGQFGEAGLRGDVPVCAAVAEQRCTKPNSGLGSPTVVADIEGHRINNIGGQVQCEPWYGCQRL